MLYHFHCNVVLNLSASLQIRTPRIARFLPAPIMSQSPPNISIQAAWLVAAITALIQIKPQRLNREHSPTRYRHLSILILTIRDTRCAATLDVLSAIDLDFLAGHVACRIRAQEEDHACNLIRRADAPHRNCGR